MPHATASSQVKSCAQIASLGKFILMSIRDKIGPSARIRYGHRSEPNTFYSESPNLLRDIDIHIVKLKAKANAQNIHFHFR